MAGLLLDSLEIKGFRAFHDLRVEKLGRVNLIVGPNNVGKTCLLEALQIYAGRAHPRLLWQLLQDHDEDSRASSTGDHDVNEVLSILQNMFYGRPEMTGPVSPIEIGPIGEPEKTLRLSIGFYISSSNEKGHSTLQLLSPEEYSNSDEPLLPRFTVQIGEGRKINYPLEGTSQGLKPEIQPPINCLVVDTHSLNKKKVSELWDKIVLTDPQKEVLKALRLLAPGLEDISMVGDFGTRRERFPVIKIPSFAKSLPLRSVGEGMQRVLAIALSLVNAQNGLLLIDEIEHGIYYDRQVELWDLIFQIARQLKIQVFATSHSWDSIVAFRSALEYINEQKSGEDEEPEGMAFRLDFEKGETSATLYDQRLLSIAVRQTLEVR